jgi:hypothetical protein
VAAGQTAKIKVKAAPATNRVDALHIHELNGDTPAEKTADNFPPPVAKKPFAAGAVSWGEVRARKSTSPRAANCHGPAIAAAFAIYTHSTVAPKRRLKKNDAKPSKSRALVRRNRVDVQAPSDFSQNKIITNIVKAHESPAFGHTGFGTH